MIPTQSELESLTNEFQTELFERVLPFWMEYSPDYQYGGYFNCLDRDGSLYDSTKHVWLQARQVWMFSKLYNDHKADLQWLEMAGWGMDFLTKYARRADNRVYFSLTRNGEPIYLQRKMFSECFYIMALAQYSKASGEHLENEIKDMFKTIWELAFVPGATGRPVMPGNMIEQTLAVPMILLNVIEEIADDNKSFYDSEIHYCIQAISKHLIDGKMYENLVKDGSQSETSASRLLSPGHAIEAGWFLQHWALELQDSALLETSANIIRNAFHQGWDNEFEGLFYFIDADGKSPTQLEWDMKLWWPHCEAMYGFLLNYATFGLREDWELFLKVKAYAFEHFSDPKNGEWYGYLNRQGRLTHSFKGGPYKGCFHVPRALYYCYNVLKRL
ncbi:N-acylglucosamine 2-epimerase [candidate division KSB1 bacterium]|nr:N-acylglucosamine 2-epimerase [candidate division KSB1 bacterium]